MQIYNGNVYKYYPASRVEFFNDFMVRFTQTKDLNDPDECLPEFNYFCDKEIKTQRAIATLNRNCSNCLSPSKRKRFIRNFRRTFNWRKEIEAIYRHHLDIIGIFSLAKTQFNSHLWNNYACDGFCVEFDQQSDFFHRRNADIKGTGELYSVDYSDVPIDFDARKFFNSPGNDYMQLKVFYQKKDKWSLEDEVRIIRLRCLADRQLNDRRISLFKIPQTAIKAIYFSPNADDDFIMKSIAKIREKSVNIPIYKVINIEKKEIQLI